MTEPIDETNNNFQFIDITKRDVALKGIAALLAYLGEDTTRNGIVDTPKRVLAALEEMTAGNRECASEILDRVFDQPFDEIIILDGVEFTSICEHHLLPFNGTATVGYLPNATRGVVGISKLARLVQCFARRLQIQERMASQIADELNEHLKPRGCGVIIRAIHSCMACRGVKQSNAEMVTSVFRGTFRTDNAARAEFLSLLRRN